MTRKILLYVVIFLLLTYWFYISPEFKEISAWVAIFLFWMRFLQDGFKNFTGWTFERILQKSTDKTWKWLLFGFISASIMQSSSLVIIISVSFLSAELITLLQWITIVLWANLGSTTWVWIFALLNSKWWIWAFWLPLIVFWIMFVFQKTKMMKWIWYVLAGLWFILVGMWYMKDWFTTLQESVDLSGLVVDWFLWILLFTLIWFLITLVTQSSLATILLILSAFNSWVIWYENALALVIWANIWTSITSFLVSLTWNKDSKRLGFTDMLIKLSWAVIFIIFFYQIVPFIDFISTIFWIWSGQFALKLALFHTLFNLVWDVVILTFINTTISILKKVFPENRVDVYWSIYLNKESVGLPDTAIISLVKESRHLYYNAIEVILESLGLKQSDIIWELNFSVVKEKIKILGEDETEDLYTKKVKWLYWEIVEYATLAQTRNDKEYHDDFSKIKTAGSDIAEAVKLIMNMQDKLEKFLKSTNLEIKTQYEKVIFEFIELISDINKLKNEKNEDKILTIYSKIEKTIESNNIINNWVIDSLIREQKITNEMATSLINVTNDKIEIFENLSKVAEIIFNNNVSDKKTELNTKKTPHWLEDNLGLSEKKREKTIEKLKKYEKKLYKKLKDVKKKDIAKKERLGEEMENIKFLIDKYKK